MALCPHAPERNGLDASTDGLSNLTFSADIPPCQGAADVIVWLEHGPFSWHLGHFPDTGTSRYLEIGNRGTRASCNCRLHGGSYSATGRITPKP